MAKLKTIIPATILELESVSVGKFQTATKGKEGGKTQTQMIDHCTCRLKYKLTEITATDRPKKKGKKERTNTVNR